MGANTESSLPLVSVVIATYRRPQLVVRAIRSALNQGIRDMEVIVVDDASQDQTERMVRGIGDARVRYVCHDCNRGLPASRNTGIRLAKGRYVAFLDDDDEWLADKTRKQLSYIEVTGVDAVVGMGLIDGRIPSDSHERSEVTLSDLRRGNKWGSCTLFVKASVIRDVMFDETLTVGEDWDVFIRLAERYRIGCLNEPLFIYHQVGQQAAAQRMISTAIDKAIPSELEARAAMLRKHRKFLGENWFNYHFAGILLSYIGWKQNKTRFVRYAIRRCGAVAVIRVLFQRLQWHGRGIVLRVARYFAHNINGRAA